MKKILQVSLAAFILASLPFLSACGDGFYYGHPHGGWGHGGWGHGHGGDHHHHLALESTSENSAAILARDFDISRASADRIVAFAASTDSQEQLKTLSAMGVRADELAPLSKMEMPTRETIQKIAAHLGEKPAKIENLFQGFIADAKTDQSGLNR